MNKTVSAYLNLVRFSAATVVVLAHILPVLFPNAALPTPGHEAVIMFFVMSGYVIAYASDQRERTLAQYAFSRLTRIYLVAVPALVLGTVLSHYAPAQINDTFPLPATRWELMTSVLASGLFLGQSWFTNVTAPLNSAYWSLNYEAWYYAMFGAWTFIRPGLRGPACMGLAILAGPKILALFPCWALGVVVYRHRRSFLLSPLAATAVLLASGVAVPLVFATGFDVAVRAAISQVWPGYHTFAASSNKAPTDVLIALCFAASIVAVANGAWPSRVLLSFARPIRWGADRALSIYLFHLPVFAFLYGNLHLGGWSAVGAEVLAILVLAELTEMRLRGFRMAVRRMVQSVRMAGSAREGVPAAKGNLPST